MNSELPPEISDLVRREVKTRVDEWLNRLGLCAEVLSKVQTDYYRQFLPEFEILGSERLLRSRRKSPESVPCSESFASKP